MKSFLSCDWGTSAFRLNLVEVPAFTVIDTVSSDQGILSTYNSWKSSGVDGEGRMAYYLDIIAQHIARLASQVNQSLEGLPVLISGMASSSVGMKPVPYQHLPFAIDGSGALAEHLPATKNFPHDLLLISGVQSNDDVMRGEETQLIGCIPADLDTTTGALFIFPGTHSKHIQVHNGLATAFTTFMTGEFFDLLSTKSILAAGVVKSAVPPGAPAFRSGVAAGRNANLLHASFRVRTNQLFGVLSPEDNHQYLSGLLIGSELQHLAGTDPKNIYLCCGSNLKPLYEMALEELGLGGFHSLPAASVDLAVMKGQYLIYEKFIPNA